MKISEIPFKVIPEEVLIDDEYYAISIRGEFKDGIQHKFMYLSGKEILKLKAFLES